MEVWRVEPQLTLTGSAECNLCNISQSINLHAFGVYLSANWAVFGVAMTGTCNSAAQHYEA
jgi:hypothetical protein